MLVESMRSGFFLYDGGLFLNFEWGYFYILDFYFCFWGLGWVGRKRKSIFYNYFEYFLNSYKLGGICVVKNMNFGFS